MRPVAYSPTRQFFTVGGWRFGVIHPWWGMEPDGIEERILQELGPQDIILYGHTHEKVEHRVGDTLIVNPGPGYPDFMMPGSVAMLTLGPPDSVDVGVPRLRTSQSAGNAHAVPPAWKVSVGIRQSRPAANLHPNPSRGKFDPPTRPPSFCFRRGSNSFVV